MKRLLLITLCLALSTTVLATMKPTEPAQTEEECFIKKHTRFEKVQNTVAFLASSGAYMLWTQDCLCSKPAYKKAVGVLGVINIALTSKVMLRDWKWYVAYLKAIGKPSPVKKHLKPIL